MIKSHATICCTDIRQLAVLDQARWPACQTQPELMLTNHMRVLIEDSFDEGSFENALTGIAIDLGKQYPGLTFQINAWLHNTEQEYREVLIIEYHGGNIAVHIETENLPSGQNGTKQTCTYSIPRVEIEK